MSADIIAFPQDQNNSRGDGLVATARSEGGSAATGVNLYTEPLRQALTSEGMPVRVGDPVTITDTAGRRTSGMVQKVGLREGAAPEDNVPPCGTRPGAHAVCQVYEVMCTDAIRRVVTADQIEALS